MDTGVCGCVFPSVNQQVPLLEEVCHRVCVRMLHRALPPPDELTPPVNQQHSSGLLEGSVGPLCVLVQTLLWTVRVCKT